MSKKKSNDGSVVAYDTPTESTGNGEVALPGTPLTPAERYAANPGGNAQEMKESKRERFVRLANARMPKVLQRLAQIKTLANKAQYEYTADEVEKIVGTLYAEVEDIARAFQGKEKAANGWSL